MNESSFLIKDIIKYLKDVYDGEKIEGLSQSFFISNKELDKILSEYFVFFKNENELLNDVRYNYNLIKDMSFPYQEGDYIYVRDLSIENIVYYSKEQHNSYSHRIHSHLIKVFEEKLNGVKDEINDQNLYPHIFISANTYLKFIEYTSKHIIDYYLDYSYLKKRLEHEKLIHYIKDNEFMLILYEEMKLISKKNYEKYFIINKLSSLKKSSSTSRENNFNNIFG
jgi:hypothetical protein